MQQQQQQQQQQHYPSNNVNPNENTGIDISSSLPKKKRKHHSRDLPQHIKEETHINHPSSDVTYGDQSISAPKRKKKNMRTHLTGKEHLKDGNSIDSNVIYTGINRSVDVDIKPNLDNKEEELKQSIRRKKLINELCMYPEMKEIFLKWSEHKSTFVIRRFTDIFIVAYKGNARTSTPQGGINIEGKAVNFGTHFTGEYSHCELVFASIEEDKPRKTCTRDTFDTIRERGKKKNQTFYCAFRITTNTPVASFKIYKEMGKDWSYGKVDIERKQIISVLLWCATQKIRNKSFDRTYFWAFALNSSLARLRFNSIKETDVGNWSLSKYICTSLTAMALSVAIPELEKLFDDSPIGLGENQDLKIWHLYPGDLLNVLTSMNLIKNDRNMFFGEIQV